jgi:hypothetical protein
MAGDLFDGPSPSTEVAAAARETVRRVVSSGRPVFVVPGNHDALTLGPDPYRDGLGGAHIFRAPSFGPPVTVETEGGTLHVYGIAHDAARDRAPLAGFRRGPGDGVHVVLLHGSVPDSPHWDTAAGGLRLEPEALAALDADYIALGDYHRFRPPAGFGGAPACYAGSFAALDLTEDGTRGDVLAVLEPGAAPRVELRPSGVTPVVDVGAVDVGGVETDVEAARAVAARVPASSVPVARLTGSPPFPLSADAVATELRTRFGAALVRDDTSFHASTRLDELAETDTVVGHVVRLGRARITAAPDPERRRAAERALRVALTGLGVS